MLSKRLALPVDSYYVEGWALCDGVVIEHGWLEIERLIVDPTLHARDQRAEKYFAGPRYRREQVRELLIKIAQDPVRPVGIDEPLVGKSGLNSTVDPVRCPIRIGLIEP